MHSYTVSLRIESPTLVTSDVTKQMGITPTQTRSVGQWRGPDSAWERALWEFDVEPAESEVDPENWPGWPQWRSLEAALAKLLSIFSPHTAVIRAFSQHHHVYLWVGHFSSSFDGGPWLSADILRALGEFGVAVRVGTYFSKDNRS